MNSKLAKWLAWKLPPAVLLWAIVRAFAFFGDSGNHNYKEVYDMLVKKYGIVDR